MKYVQVQFTIADAGQSDILIAMLADNGFDGFEENDNNILKAFIKEEALNKDALDSIAAAASISYTTTLIEQQNWNAQWESSFEPVVIGNFAAIRAGFHQPVKEVQYEIVITPKMSFGTGHHATTYLVIEQMQHIDFTHKTVLDFGTGTGVLAILAEKMGAAGVMAIDNDDWSIDNAKENIAANGVAKITLQKAETIADGDTYDIIIANINLNVILHHMPIIARVSKKGTVILLSGFLKEDEAAISTALQDNGLIFNGVSQQKDWICVVATKV